MTPRGLQWAGLAVGLAVFAVVMVDEATHGPLTDMDQGVYDSITAAEEDGVPLNAIGEIPTHLVSVPYAVTITIVATVAFWLLGDRRMAVLAAVSGLVAGAAIWGLKQSIQRPLPPKAAGAWYGFSFPSGHTISAVANVGLLILLATQVYVGRKRPTPERARTIWRWATAAWAVFALAMGVGRILTQRHWAADVYASWGIGLALACAMLLAAKVPQGAIGPVPKTKVMAPTHAKFMQVELDEPPA